MNTWVTVLISAGVGVLVSGILTLIGQRLERHARREEILLQEALKLARLRREFVLEVAKHNGQNAEITDDAITAETYFRWLRTLLDTGKLPADAAESSTKT
jgi:hypothetical protein